MIPENTAPTHKPPFLIGGIADLLRWFELLIFTISAPVLTFAGVIAVVDLLTGGKLLATQPGFVFAFGVALAVGIDSNLPAAWERVRDAWESKERLKLLLWAVIGLWTGAVVFTALRVFSIEQSQHISENAALALIGIDPDVFATQRDLLAVVLIGLSGLARVKARAVSRAEEREHLQRELEMEPLRQQVEQLKQRRVVNAMVTGRAAVDALRGTEATTETAAIEPHDTPPDDEPPTPPRGGGRAPAPTAATASLNPLATQEVRTIVESAAESIPAGSSLYIVKDAPKGRRRNAPGRRTKSGKRDTSSVRKLAEDVWHPGMTLSEMQAETAKINHGKSISRGAASKYMKIFEAEHTNSATA